MHIWYILSFMSMEELQHLGNEMGVYTLPSRKTDAAMTLSDILQTPAGFFAAYQTLSSRDKVWLRYFLFAMKSDGYVLYFPKNQLNVAFSHDQILRYEAETSLFKMQALGFFGRSHNWYVSESLECADELLNFMYDAVYQDLFEDERIDESRVQPYIQNGFTFIRDIGRLLSLMVQRQIGFTKNNVLYKREIQRLIPYFRSHAVVSLSGSGAWEGVPGAIVIAIKQLINFKLIKFDAGTVSLQGKNIEEWLDLSDDQVRALMQKGLMEIFRDTPSHIYGVLTSWVNHGKKGEWVPIQSLLDQAVPFSSNEFIRPWNEMVGFYLEVVAMTGIIDFGVLDDGRSVARIAKWSSAKPRGFVIQPTLDIFVPEEAPVLLHLLVGQMADLAQADVMSTYRLSKERVLQLCDRGWEFEDLKRALTELSEKPVQDSVLRTIADWMGAYSRAVIWDSMFVRFQSPEWLNAFVYDKRAESVVEEVMGDLVVIIKRSGEKRAREILADIGAPAPQDVRKPFVESGFFMRGGSKQSKANQDALNRLIGVEVIDFISMKVTEGAKRKG